MKHLVLLLCLVPLVGCANNPPPAAPQPAGPPLTDVGPLHDRAADFAPTLRARIIIRGYPLLEVGMTRADVRAIMGSPDLAAPLYTKQQPVTFRGWAYRYIASESEVISLYFDPVDNRLQLGMSHGIPGLKPLGGQPGTAR